jgi:two-component system phosphate regulon sensor histidine kinase PhoR
LRNTKPNAIVVLRDKKSMESNLEEIKRMQQIIENLLTLSRIDSYEPDIFTTKQYLHPILMEVCNKLKDLAKSKNVTLTLTVPRTIQLALDKPKIEQAFFNVIDNAIKYTKSNGSVIVTAQKIKDTAQISITDTGIGIAQEDLPLIFERFFRGRAQFTKQIAGTGLGLAISKLIILKHKGTISLQSTLHKGTIVTIILPLLFM